MQKQPRCEFCKNKLSNECKSCSCTKMAGFPGVTRTTQNPDESKCGSVIRHTSDVEYRLQKKMLSSLKKSSASALVQIESMIAQAYSEPSTSQLQGISSETQKNKRPSGKKITSKLIEYRPYVNNKLYKSTPLADSGRSTITSQSSTVFHVNYEEPGTSASNQETGKCTEEPTLSSSEERAVSKSAIQNLEESSGTVIENMSLKFREQIASSSCHTQTTTQHATITSSQETSIRCNNQCNLDSMITKSSTVQSGYSMDIKSLHASQANPEQLPGSKLGIKRSAGEFSGSSPLIQDTATSSQKTLPLTKRNYHPKVSSITDSVTIQCGSSMDSGNLHESQPNPEQPAVSGSKHGTQIIAGDLPGRLLYIQDTARTSLQKTLPLRKRNYHPKISTVTDYVTVQCGSSMYSGSLHAPQVDPEQPAAPGSKHLTKRNAEGLPGSSLQIQDTARTSSQKTLPLRKRNYHPIAANLAKSITVQCGSSMDSGNLHEPQPNPVQHAVSGSKHGTKRINEELPGSLLRIQDTAITSSQKTLPLRKRNYHPKVSTLTDSVTVQCGSSMNSVSLHEPQVNPVQPAESGSKHLTKRIAGELPGSSLHLQDTATKSSQSTSIRCDYFPIFTTSTDSVTIQCGSSMDSGSLHAPQMNPEHPVASGSSCVTEKNAKRLPGSSLHIQDTATSSQNTSIRCDYFPIFTTSTDSVKVQCGSSMDSGSFHAPQMNPEHPVASGSSCVTEKIARKLPGSSQGSCTTPILVDLAKESPLDYYCKRCNKLFGSFVDLDAHIDELVKDGVKNVMSHKHSPHYRRTGFFVCQVCQERFDSRSDLDCHLGSHRAPTPYKCLFCFKSFRKEPYLSKHEYSEHRKETIRKCLSCHERFLSDTDLVNHPCDP